jgi:RNA polymerase sigma-70 factor (ECF subfamily)
MRDVDRVTQRAHARAAAAWPDLDVSAAEFATRVRTDDVDAIDALHAADLYLACACARGDARALAAFEARYFAELPAYLSRFDANAAFIDEVRQVLRAKLFVAEAGSAPKIAEYSGRGALASWVRIVALRQATEMRRDPRARLVRDSEEDARALGPTPDPELSFIKRRYKGAFEDALRDALSALDSEQRTLLRLHFVDGLNVDKLGAMHKVHRATAARWVAAARDALLAGVRARLRERLRLRGSELDSLLALVRSRIDVTLSGLLRER